MTLQDTFKKKTGNQQRAESSIARLSSTPSQDDLRHCMSETAANSGRPSTITWPSDRGETFVLTATQGASSREPSWTLHVGDNAHSALVLSYTTADPLLIESFIIQYEAKEQPRAVIPDALKPCAESDKEESSPEAPRQHTHDEFPEGLEIISRIGYGGMGVIYKAKHKQTGELLALKVLHGHLLEDEENKTRFMQEASACLELKHRNLIHVHEFGLSKSGQPYMLMEYLEGSPLSTLVQNHGILEMPRFINIFTQICDGLQFAHERGIVHRDVKPSNIMISKSEEGVETAKLLDFGIAKMRAETDQRHLTPTGTVMGSPAYIAPEQCAGAPPEPRIDVYALGCVMYEALAGRPPFMHESPIKILMMQLSEAPQPLSAVCPEPIPPALENIIMRCLEKNPLARYESASDLDADLWEFAYLYSRGEADSIVAEAMAVIVEEEALADKSPATNPINQVINSAAGAELQIKPQSSEKSGDIQSISASESEKSPASTGETPSLLLRLRRCRSIQDMDSAWEGLNMALKIQSRSLPATILLDMESAVLVMRKELSSSMLGLDMQAIRRISAMQALLQQLIKQGAAILVAERWATRGITDVNQLMPGVHLLNDEEMCDLLLENSGSIIDY